jgi:hypothetical protein
MRIVGGKLLLLSRKKRYFGSFNQGGSKVTPTIKACFDPTLLYVCVSGRESSIRGYHCPTDLTTSATA